MGVKWKGDYSAKTQRAFGLVIGLVVGVLTTVVILGSLWNWGVLTGANLWDVMTAIGTLAVVIVSAALALRDAWARRIERKEKAEISAIMLWPVLRKYLSSIRTLQRAGYLDRYTAIPPEVDAAERALEYLASSYDESLALVKDLNPNYRSRGLRSLAHLNHAQRHLSEILDEREVIAADRYSAKLKAAKLSLKKARKEIAPLISYCKAIIEGDSPRRYI